MSLAQNPPDEWYHGTMRIKSCPCTGKLNIRHHRAIRQEVSGRIFAPIQSLENEGILYVFLVFQTEEVGQKDGGDSQTQLCGAAIIVPLYFSTGRFPRQRVRRIGMTPCRGCLTPLNFSLKVQDRFLTTPAGRFAGRGRDRPPHSRDRPGPRGP